MYPLRFTPVFKRYIWGGRRLASILGKPIGDESCAESWEIVDHNENQSVVENGPLAGKTLHVDFKVVNVEAATPDEIAHGHAH